eukprot:gene16057-22194_t
MGFFGTILKPGKSVPYVPPPEDNVVLHLSQATLSAKVPVGKRVSVLITQNDEPPVVIATLRAGTQDSVPLDLFLEQYAEISTEGDAVEVHLSGYYSPQQDDTMGQEGSDDEDEDGMMVVLIFHVRRGGMKRGADSKPATPAPKHAKVAAVTPASAPAKSEPKTPAAKTPVVAKPAQKTPVTAPVAAKAGNVRRWENGFEIEDVKMGPANGKLAKAGKKVSVQYVGKLKSNGKVFDKSGGRAFSFRLGVGEVIKGWDKGVEGMRVGDKRKLSIPPQLAYGSTGVRGTIPPNATLDFDVELVDVK